MTAAKITFRLLPFRTLARDAAGPGYRFEGLFQSAVEITRYCAACATPQLDTVAPSREVAIAIARGACPTGYGVEIIAVVEEASDSARQLHVYYSESNPTRIATSVAAYPHHVIALASSAGAARFRHVSDRMRRVLEEQRWLNEPLGSPES
jgi:hypothetical protein